MRSSWMRASPCNVWLPSKKWRTKVRTALGSEVGRKGSRRNGRSRARMPRQVSNFHFPKSHEMGSDREFKPSEMGCPTSIFNLLRATSNQFLDLLWLDCLASPGVFPSWLWWELVCERTEVGVLPGLAPGPVSAFEFGEETRHSGIGGVPAVSEVELDGSRHARSWKIEIERCRRAVGMILRKRDRFATKIMAKKQRYRPICHALKIVETTWRVYFGWSC
jgi:hypothetical protein